MSNLFVFSLSRHTLASDSLQSFLPISSSFAPKSNYAIIYLFLEAFAIVYGEEGFNLGPARSSLPFFGVLIGFVIAFCLYYYQLRYESHAARKSFQKKEEEEIKQGLEPQTKLGGGALDLVSLSTHIDQQYTSTQTLTFSSRFHSS